MLCIPFFSKSITSTALCPHNLVFTEVNLSCYSARRDEPRREDQGEQQAPAPQGPVLPPPPPVDYGVFMQGLVQAMQTQAHTQAALQAQLEAQQAQAPAPQADHGGPSIMERF
ncbi:hypothetical protein Taro_025817, partial [Colocasia esculenta]|nr:hypothetical protein [Colocasia esculenta]